MRLIVAALFALVIALPACAQPVETFQAGKHYHLIDPPQPTSSGSKVEVLEAFMYTCPHCADLEPYLHRWAATKADDIAYSPLPVAWNGPAEAFARAFYAAEILGILEQSHQAMFDAIHKERVPFQDLESVAQWYTRFGVTKEAFLSAAQSFAVNTKINRAKQLTPRLGISGTPSVVVNGKYRFDVNSAGGHQKVPELIDYLVAKERAEKKPG